jgi:hypothetical protein
MTNFKSLLPVLGATLLAAQLGLAQNNQMSFFITSAGPAMAPILAD